MNFIDSISDIWIKWFVSSLKSPWLIIELVENFDTKYLHGHVLLQTIEFFFAIPLGILFIYLALKYYRYVLTLFIGVPLSLVWNCFRYLYRNIGFLDRSTKEPYYSYFRLWLNSIIGWFLYPVKYENEYEYDKNASTIKMYWKLRGIFGNFWKYDDETDRYFLTNDFSNLNPNWKL